MKTLAVLINQLPAKVDRCLLGIALGLGVAAVAIIVTSAMLALGSQ